MNRKFLIRLILSGIIFTGLNSFEKDSLKVQFYSTETPHELLIKYGERIFNHEKCLDCHSLKSSEIKPSQISLDGYGGLRSSKWLYLFFKDPKMLISKSTMPSYVHLTAENLDKEEFSDYMNISINDIDKLWNLTIQASDSIKKQIEDRDFKIKSRSKILALIAFIQQIPASKEKQIKDSISNHIIDENWKIAKALYVKNTGELTDLSRNVEIISKGNQVYNYSCRTCHGENGKGEIGPNLTDEFWIIGNKPGELFDVIKHGTDDGMPAFKNILSPEETGKVVAYLFSIQGTNKGTGKSPNGTKRP